MVALVSSYNPKICIEKATLSMVVSVNSCMSACVSSEIDWQPLCTMGFPCLSPGWMDGRPNDDQTNSEEICRLCNLTDENQIL